MVAVVYREARGGDPYIRVSSDSGQTWSARVRLNTAVADGGGTLGAPFFVEVDASGVIHAAFVQDSGIGRQVFYTRSTDGGVSFEPERTLDSLLTARTDSTNPILQTAFDGSLLLAFWDAAGDDHLYVLRSTDAGQTFALVLDRTFGNEETELFPMLFASTSGGAVVVHVIDGTGELTAQRSTTDGASYGPVRTLSSTAAAHPFLGIEAAAVTRTAAGTLAIAYTDRRADTYRGNATDLFVRVSTNDGHTWGSEARVDGTAPGTAGTGIAPSGISGVGNDDLVVVYADNRGNAGSSFDVYGNRSAAATLSFGAEQRIDADSGDRDRNAFDAPNVAVGPRCGGGAGEVNVYVAMAVISGTEPEIRVAVSEDGGYTFSGATRISAAAGSEFAAVPRIAAPGNGSVHVAYTVIDPATGDVELRYNKSDDCGQTWLANELNFELVTQAEFDLIALDNGEVYLVWSEGGLEIRLAKSTDGGDSFATPVFVNTNLSGFNRNPLACVVGSTVFVAFAAPDGPGDWYTTFLAASGDGGATFVPEVQMLPDMASGGSFEHTLDCYESLTGAAGVYAAVMANAFGPTEAPSIRWFGFDPVGETLTPLTLFPSSPGADYGVGSGVLCLDTEPGPGSCLFLADESVSEPNGDRNRVVLRRYGSDGVLALEHTLTSAAPLPEARSDASRMVTDGEGNVWVAWRDSSAGQPQMVVRHSADSGQTFDDLYRLSRAEPQGTAFDSLFDFIKKGYGAADAGAAFFGWAGRRDSQFFSGLFGVYDSDDFDRDQSAAAADCNDQDPTARSVAAELTSFHVDRIGGGVRVSWDSQAGAGSGTVYDLVQGSLGALRSSGSFAAAACLVSDTPNVFAEDLSAAPPPGEADYYLGRAKNGCGTASFGDSSLAPDPRDDLDGAGPCP